MRPGDERGQQHTQHQQQPPCQGHRSRGLPTVAKELLAGFAAGASNVTSGYPFDTVKVRLQSACPGQYRGAWHCLTTIVRHEGIRRGLFRGLSSPLIGGTAETGINYLAIDSVYSRVLHSVRPPDGSPTPLPSVAVAGAVAGVALSVVLGPTELIKCRMQLAGSSSRYPGGPLQCLREVVRWEGGVLRGLSRGLGATLAREIPGNALFFTTYEGLRRSLIGDVRQYQHQHQHQQQSQQPQQQHKREVEPPPGSATEPLPKPTSSQATRSLPYLAATPYLTGDITVGADARGDGGSGSGSRASRGAPPQEIASGSRLEHLEEQPDGGGAAAAAAATTAPQRHWCTEAAIAVFCGGAAGTLMWAAVLPIDVAKTRLQTSTPGSKWDVSLRTHWLMLWREGGFSSLYAGLTPTLVRAFPANACQWLAWELVMRGLRDSSESVS
ncbi:mitochondrial substrate carrier [Volvox carteri f. nagariensis]|uniref:Mitochondrial substrate carrier n=1 Tax=Volvox carteri f. nagariensis TaxID=3068 RepID=D8UGU3_VOLCA|nr:mitochondrial substrate carrier [Volvox carteri f. nagariensis]EFJ41041.1 mitochondrial substrate carrier [Volvox carteri f. nagariensis]|eukprot:XP_002957905.1 mitochondrial substrate carrier [Volvox carteri f. nagariensis]